MSKSDLLGPLVLAAIVLAGCAKPPSEHIEAAEQAVTDVRQSGANTYAPDDFAKLEGTVAAIKREVSEQDAKFALFRDYGKAEQLALSAQTESDRVKTAALKKKEESKAVAQQAYQVAQEAVTAAMALVARAPVGKDRAALEAIKNDVHALKASLNQVQLAVDREDYLAAQAQAKAIHEKSQAVSAEINTALAKTGKRPAPAGRPR